MALISASSVKLLTILVCLSMCFWTSQSSDVKIKVSKIDSRFSNSRQHVDLFGTCNTTISIQYRETRRLTMCNPDNVPLGVPTTRRHHPYVYDLEIMGKPGMLFTVKEEPDSAHNSYFGNEVLNFGVYPGKCKKYSITNLGDGVKNSRMILNLQDLQRPVCSERQRWLNSHKRKHYSFLPYMPEFDEKLIKSLRVILIATFKMQPIKGLDVILKTFWPKDGPSMWDKMKSEIAHKVREADMARINETSRQHLKVYRDKLNDLEMAINLGIGLIENLFMSISGIFIGNENYVMFEDNAVSKEMLPLFTAIISLFINFHIFAIASADSYNFHSDNVILLKERRDRLVQRAHDYILDVYDENMEYAFETCDLSSDFYNCIVDAHNQITQNGMQFLPAWRSVSNYRSNDSRVHDPMFYSHSYGIPSTELLKSALFHTTKPFPQITSPFSKKGCELYSSDEKCFERLNATHIYVTYHNESKRISQMWFSIEKRDMAEYPANMWDSFTLQENEVVSSLIVGGEGNAEQIDFVKFILSSGEVYTFGYANYKLPSSSRTYVTFEMEDHFVSQAIIFNDDIQEKNGQKNLAKNVVVSYRRNRIADDVVIPLVTT